MSLFARRSLFGITAPSDLIPIRTNPMAGSSGAVSVTRDSALRMSAVWACLRLRASLVSTMPCDVYRSQNGMQVEVNKAPVLVAPGGERWGYIDWMYATQMDLDRAGNTIGLITEVNAAGLPARIDLQNLNDVTILERRDTGTMYKIAGKEYTPDKVWHERSHPVPGMTVGLSPVAYAAMSIGQYQSAQQYALDWYAKGGVPMAHFKNTAMSIVDQTQAETAKARFKAAQNGRDIFVTGQDWEFLPLQAEAVGMEWLESQKFSVSDVARFFDVPGDLIDAGHASDTIKYANITQHNLQFLVLHLGPAITRRETALSRLLPAPRFVKINRDALLAMDPQMRATVMGMQIDKRVLAPSEARALNNLPPFTESQMAEFDRLFGSTAATPAGASNSAVPEGVSA